VKDSNCDLLADLHIVINRQKNCFPQLVIARRVSNVRQIVMNTAKPLVLDPSSLDVDIFNATLVSWKSPSSDQIPAELIQAGARGRETTRKTKTEAGG
jgi:hypothetical protein